MTKKVSLLNRRRFLKGTLAVGAAAFAAPQIIPSSALGRDGAISPSERIVVGGIGIGNRGTYDLGCFLEQKDVQFVAVCDVKQARREAVKKMADDRYGNKDCAMIRDFRELLDRQDIDAVLIATGPNWHATAAMNAARAGKDIYCEKPCTKNIAQSLILRETMRRTGRVFQAGTQRRSLPHFAFACELARTGKLGKLKTIYAHPAGMTAMMSGWLPAEQEPAKDVVDWDMYLGPAAWRPFNPRLLDGFNFEKGGGLVGGGVLEWGSHCVDLCQWADERRDCPPPIEYNAPQGWASSSLKLCERWLRVDASAKPAGFRSAPAPCVLKEKPVGWKLAIVVSWCLARPSCSPAEKWRSLTATRPRSTCVISSTA